MIVPDPAASQFWTMLYMCPNGFELYDKSNEFEHYDMVLSAIKGRDAEGALEAMVGFSIRMVLQRWEKILEYFTWLLGHRDSLSDPDAHDSLLFDDDSFSRSRRYFWAINYLAELDISISRNIIQLDRFIREDSPNKSLREQLNQLQHLRERILGQRDEAIALRDGVSNFNHFIRNAQCSSQQVSVTLRPYALGTSVRLSSKASYLITGSNGFLLPVYINVGR